MEGLGGGLRFEFLDNLNAAMQNSPIERQAVRAILITPDHEILLMRIRLEDVEDVFWIAPGGGLEDGETAEQALRRELQEELGLEHFEIGPLVWLRQHTFGMQDRRMMQTEQYWIVHTDRFDPVISDEVEASYLDRFEWWKAEDLGRTDERLTPLSLAAIVKGYLERGAPTTTLELEVLVD